MSTYTMKKALVDLGFIDGYVHVTSFNFHGLEESLWDALTRLEDRLVTGKIEPHLEDPNARSHCLHDLGFIRGMLWETPIPRAVSEALDRLVNFATGDNEFACLLTDWDHVAEPKEQQLSLHQRDVTLTTGGNGDDAWSAEFARGIGAPHLGVLDVWRRLGVMDEGEIQEELVKDSVVKTGAGGSADVAEGGTSLDRPGPRAAEPRPSGSIDLRQSAWTPERRAAQAERAKNRLPLVPDSALESIKADWEAGLPFDRIGSKYGCSGSHIRNFLMKNGIDPRRGRRAAVLKETAAIAEPSVSESAPTPGICEVYVKPDVFKMLTGNQADDAPNEEGDAPVQNPAARWKPSPLSHGDWTDIQTMLTDGRTREAIAGDYDVPVDDLDAFIEERLEEGRVRRAAKEPPLGEAQAPFRT